MKELMENGPVQGKCLSSRPPGSRSLCLPETGHSTAAQVVCIALSSHSTGAGS